MGYAQRVGSGREDRSNVPFEYSGRLPEMKTGFALHRMFSHADGFEVTALQLGTLVSAMANGGKLLVPQVPQNREACEVQTQKCAASWILIGQRFAAHGSGHGRRRELWLGQESL